MHQLEITASHSRPRVSNDNAFSESLFRTTKYHPSYPSNGFAKISEAQTWAQSFVTYYNTTHKHRALNFVTPDQKHHRQDSQLLQKRENLLEAKRKENPARWINGVIRNCQPSGQVNLYPINNRTLEKHQKNAA
jgi:putative transposase